MSHRLSLGRLVRFLAAPVIAAAFLVPTTSLRAATVDLSAFGWMASTDNNVDLTVLSTANNGIVVRLQKFADFTQAPTGGEFTPLNIVFRQVSRNAVRQIAIEEETILNDTGSAWNGFRFGLSSSNGNASSFDTSASSSFSINPFTGRSYNSDNTELTLTGGRISSGAFPDNLFTPGRNAGALYINANPLSSGSNNQSFVFSEQPLGPGGGPSSGPGTPPVIPLPAPAFLTLAGLAAGGFYLHRKRPVLA